MKAVMRAAVLAAAELDAQEEATRQAAAAAVLRDRMLALESMDPAQGAALLVRLTMLPVDNTLIRSRRVLVPQNAMSARDRAAALEGMSPEALAVMMAGMTPEATAQLPSILP